MSFIRNLVKRTKKGHIHRGEEVTIPSFKAKVVNAAYKQGKLIGYRVSLDGWWIYLPASLVEKNNA